MGHGADIQDNPVRTALVRELRRVLPNLYNPGLVRNSPLIQLFDLERRRDAPGVLQRMITTAIEALEPDETVPVGSPAWRVYQVLHARYVDQFSQDEVARDMFLSPRQLRRLEQSAVEVLADHLWAAHPLMDRAQALDIQAEPLGEQEQAQTGPSGQDEELAWLERTLSSQVVNCEELIQSALNTALPLTDSLGTAVMFEPCSALPRLSIQTTPVRQALLHVITLAARWAASGTVMIQAAILGNRLAVRLWISAHPSNPPQQLHEELARSGAEGLETARKLVLLSRGTFESRTDPRQTPPFEVTITLPTAEQVPILVIDDNVDTLKLIERYLSGTPYRFVGALHPREALETAEKLAPSAVIMDVMLPDMDGWDLLGRLRAHPVTQHTPIIVCTILPQAQLALMLGAAEFLSKPIRREELLTTLDRLVDQASPESE